MSFTNFLKEQLNDFVDSYKKYLRLTYGFTLTLTILCFLIAAVLFRVSSYQDSQSARGISILSYFFQRYSQNNVYSLVDLVKTTFILIVCLFSVALVNGQKNNLNPKDYSLRYFLDSISLKSVITLTAIFAVVSILDVGLFKLESFSAANARTLNTRLFFKGICFHLRIYLPLIIFAISVQHLTIGNNFTLTFKRILWLYVSLWLVNEFAYESLIWMRLHVIGFLLIPFNDSETYYYLESILGIPVIAFYFLGYYSAMTNWFKIKEETSPEPGESLQGTSEQ